MPWKLRKAPKKDLYWVINKETGKKHSKEPLPKERAEAQMRALYANVPDAKEGKGLFSDIERRIREDPNYIHQMNPLGPPLKPKGGKKGGFLIAKDRDPAYYKKPVAAKGGKKISYIKWGDIKLPVYDDMNGSGVLDTLKNKYKEIKDKGAAFLTGTNYVGPFNRLDEEYIRTHPPTDKIDEGAMKHDLEYSRIAKLRKAGTPKAEIERLIRVSDDEFLDNIKKHWRTNPRAAAMGYAGIKGKNVVEDVAGLDRNLFVGEGKKKKAIKGGRDIPRRIREEEEERRVLRLRRLCEAATEYYRPRFLEMGGSEDDVRDFFDTLVEISEERARAHFEVGGEHPNALSIADEANRIFREWGSERIGRIVEAKWQYYETLIREQDGEDEDVIEFQDHLEEYIDDEWRRYLTSGGPPITADFIDETAEGIYQNWRSGVDEDEEEESEEESVISNRRTFSQRDDEKDEGDRKEGEDEDEDEEPPAQRQRASGKMRGKKGKGKKRLTGGALDEMEWNALSNDAIEFGVSDEAHIDQFMLHLESVIEAHDAVAIPFGRGYIMGLAGVMPQNEDEMEGFQVARGRPMGTSKRLSARGMRGNGFFGDFWNAGKQFASNVVERVKQTGESVANVFRGKAPRMDLPPKVRQLLGAYGNRPIVRMFVRRDPIQSAIDKALNVISMGSWFSLKQKYGYDTFFHLQLEVIVRVSDSDDTNARFVLQKNEVIDVSPAQPSTDKTEMIEVPMSEGHTMNSLLSNAKQTMGHKFYYYDAFHNNCQDFVGALLYSSGLMRPDISGFIKQPVDQLVQEISMTDRIARGITDLGGIIDVGLQGKGGLQPRAAFAAQLKEAGVSPSAYLETAQKKANALGLAGNMLGFSSDDKHKLQMPNAEGKMIRFGAVKLGDYILYTLQKNPEAEKHRKAYLARATKIKGDWAKDPYSANSLAIGVLW